VEDNPTLYPTAMINVVNFTRAFPKSSMVLRRIHAALSRKPYFFNRQKMRAQVFAEIDKKIVFEKTSFHW
jgi:hypothetical protein